MADETVGYARLVERHQLAALPLRAISKISTSARGRRSTLLGAQRIEEFQTSYRPEESLIGDLQFALRYEGLNLEVLSLLFEVTGGGEIRTLNEAQPQSAFARRLGYLYEWLTEEELQFTKSSGVSAKAAFVPVLDESVQFGLSAAASTRNAKYRVIDNLPGNPQFCPLVTKTPYLMGMVAKNLKQRTQDTLSKYDPELLRRAASFLYLKETHSSFEVEREHPTPDKARRFADLLSEAQLGEPLSEDRFVELQSAVVDQRFREASYRTGQNWLGDDYGYRKNVEFVPPRPEDVRGLMDGLVAFSARFRKAPDAIDRECLNSCVSEPYYVRGKEYGDQKRDY